MFEKLESEGVGEVLAYFSRDRKNCLYSYIDLKKYGIGNPNLELYVDRGAEGIRCVLTKYFSGVNVFSLAEDLNTEAAVRKLRELAPSMINAPEGTIRKLLPAFASDYVYEGGFVTQIHQVQAPSEEEFPEVEEAKEEELLEVSHLICSDEGLGGTYEPESFAVQLVERRRDGFGRNLCIRRGGKIICHAGTYAEVEDLAVISGVITEADSRGQNLAYRVVSKLSRQLLDEGKLPCLFYFTESAARLYEKVGFEPGTLWAKLIRKQG